MAEDYGFKKAVLMSAAVDIADFLNVKYGVEVDDLDIAGIMNEHLSFVFGAIDYYAFEEEDDYGEDS